MTTTTNKTPMSKEDKKLLDLIQVLNGKVNGLEEMVEVLESEKFDLEWRVRMLTAELNGARSAIMNPPTPTAVTGSGGTTRRFGTTAEKPKQDPKWVYDSVKERWFKGLHQSGKTINQEDGLGFPKDSRVYYNVLKACKGRLIKQEDMTTEQYEQVKNKPVFNR